MCMKKMLIGRNEMVLFPDLNISSIKARVDTGARTSSLHAFNIELFERAGARWVRFDFEDQRSLEARLWKQKYVRSSNGKRQSRYFIKTHVEFMKDRQILVILSLNDRSNMKYPVLLGRRLLAGRFIVDVEKEYVLGK